MTNHVALLVDGDNIFKTEYLDSGFNLFKLEFNRLVTLAFKLDTTTQDISIRIYGGWKTSNVWTNRASRMQQAIGAQQLFPFAHPPVGIVRGSVKLVTSLLVDPQLNWDTTFKVRAGLRRVTLAEAPCFDGCSSPQSECPVRRFAKFTKNRGSNCPADGCSVSNEKVFKSAEQKMVDTMLACDLIECASDDSISAVAIVTEDTDLLPALVQAANLVKRMRRHQKHRLVLPRRSSSFPHMNDLVERGIETLTWEDLENAN